VEDCIRDRVEGPPQIVVDTNIASYEVCGRIDIPPVAGAFIVDHAHFVTSGKQSVDQVTSDEPGAAGHKDPPPSHQPWSSRTLFPSSRHGLKESDDGRR